MHIRKLRLIGFKSFVEPTDLVIERGLTGVVGPNGCGKSNLLEAIRWVMGESSYKSMRASAMEDVIFAGTVSRPARNSAEVTIFIDNSGRTAPVEFNDTDEIEITRRIEREAGSAYRINGREARARDVKILFEDAATGARSPALVRQGQIGEIVNAKPEQRRRILEDAAGVAGLHSRRHDAELRLKGAENNLARIGDILGQVEGLKRQARQARRYGDLSDQIRQGEAVVLYLTWAESQSEVVREELELQAALQALGTATQEEAEATRAEAALAEKIEPLREQAMIRSAVATRQRHRLDTLAAEAERIQARQAELTAQAARGEQDRLREKDFLADGRHRLERLRDEREELACEARRDAGGDDELRAAIGEAEANLSAIEAQNSEAQSALAERRSEKRSIEAMLGERCRRRDQLAAHSAALDGRLARLMSERPDTAAGDVLRGHAQTLSAALEDGEAALADCRNTVNDAGLTLQGARDGREAARVALRSLEAEHQVLVELLHTPQQSFPPVLDQITVAAGLETALAAALGDDIEAALDRGAPVHWRLATPDGAVDAALPAAADPLIRYVDAPPALARRLRQIGVVEADDGLRLQAELAPGQRLVSRDGGLWRWDGLVAAADAPSAAAQRLAGRNRLREVEAALGARRHEAEAADAAALAATAALEGARVRERELEQKIRHGSAALAKSGEDLARYRRTLEEHSAQEATLRQSLAAAEQDHAEAVRLIDEGQHALRELADEAALVATADAIAAGLRAARDQHAEMKAELSGREREKQRISGRLAAIEEELTGWQKRCDQAAARIDAITSDLARIDTAHQELTGRPDEIRAEQDALRTAIETAERESIDASDAVAAAESALREATVTLRARAGVVAERREQRARAEARLDGARSKRAAIAQNILDALETTPDGCLEVAGLKRDDGLPALHDAEGRLARLRTDRERLGGVNLRAEGELADVESRYSSLDRERADVDEAVAKLRAGIASLNREGRKRLNEAFVTVDGHFQRLFQTLFEGGEARLAMIESDEDPLAGGLEIIAKPPGKKPATLSLLSGGEQTLTALSLIFAVFLTNPSPICVLDEVDAPLDDANVDRFCRMMEKMAEETDTRFLCITHHPETMARMQRLFGVTMAEKGVSQLVSVDLEIAERLLEAG